MRIKKIKLRNIRSYKEQEITFPEGSLLLSGDVGAGKTSILLAIEYALFGLQPGQTGSALLRNNCDAAEVVLELEINGRGIVIERRLKRSAKSIINDYAAMSIDGEKKDYSVTELKIRILAVLGYPLEFVKKYNLLYKYTVYTPQEQMRQIILEDSETRLNVLRHIFGIDKYKIIRENLNIVLSRLKEETKMLQIEVRALDEDKLRINSKKENLNILGLKIEQKERELKEKIEKRKDIELEVLSLEKTIREKDKLENELEKTRVVISAKNESLFEIKKEINEINKSLSEVIEIFEEGKLKSIMQEILAKKISLDKLNEKYVEILGQIKNVEQAKKELLIKKDRVFNMKICPTCLQDVPAAHKHNIMNETEGFLVEKNKSLGSLMREKEESLKLIEKEKIDLIQLEEKKISMGILKSKQEDYEKKKKRMQELIKARDAAEKDVAMLEKHFEVTKQDIFNFLKYHNIYKIKQDELKRAFLDEKNTEIAVAEIKKEIELTNKEILFLDGELAKKENSKKQLSELQELMDWLSSQFLILIDFTEKNVMIKLRMEFSNVFNKWFRMLAGDTLDVRLDENFTPLIIQGDVEMEYSFLSGGERTAVALAYRLALNQTINSVLSQINTRDIVILDEPTDGFSEAQIDKMRDVFDELNVGQLVIVSHEQKIENFVDNVIRLKKENNNSIVDFLPNEFFG
jgi:exonuclease SbcC